VGVYFAISSASSGGGTVPQNTQSPAQQGAAESQPQDGETVQQPGTTQGQDAAQEQGATASANQSGSARISSAPPNTIAVGRNFTVAIRNDGTIINAGHNRIVNYDLSNWVYVKTDGTHIYGLRENGRPAGRLEDAYVNAAVGYTTEWSELIAISSAFPSVNTHNTVVGGVQSDGTVVGLLNIEEWKNIIDVIVIADSGNRIIGLKSDGTIISRLDSALSDLEDELSTWTDIVAISSPFPAGLVGLKSNGTVVTTRVATERFDVSGWTDIIAISSSQFSIIGLRADGTVVAAGENHYGMLDVDGWTDIVAVAAADSFTVGLRADGTMVGVGDNSNGQLDFGDWTDIRTTAAGR
jgi:hypothetical protein